MKLESKIIGILPLILCLFTIMGMPVQAAEATNDTLDYSVVFDAAYYYNKYTDLQTLVGKDDKKLKEHFLVHGMQEGREGNADFHVQEYMENNADLVAKLGTTDLRAYYEHYIKIGKAEHRIAVGSSNVIPDDATLVATYVTEYNQEEDRAINVKLAAERINGKMLSSGQEFSFSDAVLSRISRNGYVMAPSYAGGKVVSSIGGGICQVTSTLYNTILLAGITPIERHPHSLTVDYVPVGFDAAVAEGYKDFRFANPFEYPIYIEASVEEGKLTVSILKA